LPSRGEGNFLSPDITTVLKGLTVRGCFQPYPVPSPEPDQQQTRRG
jgi:hypothetical protein